ncbi:MAG: AI-2E family transporter [Arcobacter sp.]|jgi:predicted PurR-regulated permease PerM|uniref:Autoinducer 2 (AI-2E family) transporter n=1 Tax=Arcobacter defluvii TaxID=873191 RepID=A0AAE7BEH3_9BACT|nr:MULTISPECIES: AI-2E family transporter [Arcobacter]MDY3200833.1 AI-2E family transporter [Arcobacter sp.]QKF77816.1 putative autoinducer 2 (AI-2E family) transporter [Arcobacter defluvii]RXI34215.1 AI-2E family transporter [Arcobacter defluvii]
MDAINLKNYFFYFASFVVIIAGIKMSSEVVVILFLAIFISSIFSSLLKILQKKHIPKVLSYIFILFLVILVSLMLAYVVNISLKDFITNLPVYEEKFKNLILNSIHFIQAYGVEIDKAKIMESLNFGSFFGFTTNIIGSISTFLSKFLLVVIGVAFILAESKSFQTKLRVIFRNNARKLEHFNLFSYNIQRYFVVKSFTSFLTGFIIAIMLSYFGVDYPILWGVIAMLFNFVPVVGSIIASFPAILLAIMNLDVNATIWITIFYVVINISISNILEPKLMGKELGLSPLVIFFSLIFWGYILGIVGMFLAVPITMTLKIAFDSNLGTHWLGILMSDLSRKREKNNKEA